METESAKTLFQDMEKAMDALEQRIRNHPFPRRVEAGAASPETFKHFAGEQFHIIVSDLRSVAVLLSRNPSPPAHDFIWATLQGEKAALNNLLQFGAALGMDREALENHEPAPEAHAYTAYMAWLGAYGGAGEVAAAFALNFSAWGANCRRMLVGLKRHYGFSAADLSFFELFAAPPEDLKERAIRIVAKDISSGISPRRIQRAARLLQGYELMFWDSMESLDRRSK